VRRRECIALFGGAAALWPLALRAQQSARIPRVGILSDYSAALAAKSVEPFVQTLRDLGYIEGQNIAFEYRHGDGNNVILPGLAAELVRLQPEIIFAVGTPATLAAKGATQTIPIVFARIADPVGSGFVSSLARPGGNLTGLGVLQIETGAKRLELLTMAVPAAKRVGVLRDPNFPPAVAEFRELPAAARSLDLELIPADVRAPDDFEPALRAMVQQGAGALVVLPGAVFFEHLRQLVDLTAKARLPAMFLRRDFVEAGGLMSYGTNYPDMYRRAAALVDKILKGAKPAEIPVEQPTRFELVINLKTAKALGLTVPQALRARADEVIE